MLLKDKVAVIYGAAGAIGSSVASAFCHWWSLNTHSL
jgi:NAD(P)-dependent dehydrogenase (short-subunit alcohol dehydrogenase family)